jgi:hypothetical protein
MIIRSEQLEVFASAEDKSFQERVAAYLRRNLPEHTAGLDNQELYNRISKWRTRAAGYGVTAERSIAKWCFLAMITRESFDQEPEMHKYLSEATPDPATKIDSLMDALYVRLRQAEWAGRK